MNLSQSAKSDTLEKTPHKHEYPAFYFIFLMLSCKRTAGCTYAGVVPSSTSSPLKPGCWLLILCSYINMLSSRGQRWAHTELSCCQVNTEVDVKSCRKVEHGEAGRGTLNMRELRMRSSGRKVSVVWNDRDCTQNTCGPDKSD